MARETGGKVKVSAICMVLTPSLSILGPLSVSSSIVMVGYFSRCKHYLIIRDQQKAKSQSGVGSDPSICLVPISMKNEPTIIIL